MNKISFEIYIYLIEENSATVQSSLHFQYWSIYIQCLLVAYTIAFSHLCFVHSTIASPGAILLFKFHSYFGGIQVKYVILITQSFSYWSGKLIIML